MDAKLKKHILVIAQYFYPEQFRINDITSEWVKRGYQVTVITGIPNYPQGKYYEGYGLLKKRRETYNGVDIIRIPLVPRGNNAIMLVLNYFSFVVSGFFWKMFTKIKADYVFIFEVSPMTQALPGVWYAKRRKIPCYLYVQDLWPENVEIITGIKNRRIINLIGSMVDYIYKRCTRIFTTSESFVEAIHQRGVPMSKLEFWPQYAEDFYVPMNKSANLDIPQDGALNVIFAGNIGTAQGLDILPKVAHEIKKQTDAKVRFNIIGDGRYKKELIDIVSNSELRDYFNFIDKKPAELIPEYMACCDVAFLSLADNILFSKTIPAKLQSYMACGIPSVGSATGETARIINESESGLCSSPGDVDGLVINILKFIDMSDEKRQGLATKARQYYESNFNKLSLLDRMDKHFIG